MEEGMEEIQIVAMIDRSAGNDTIGDMWTETKIFNSSESLMRVYMWATKKKNPTLEDIMRVQANIKLAIAQ
jgi:hypothetical protein